MKQFFITILLSLLSVLAVKAQVSVENEIDSIQVLIGEQAHLTIKVTAKKGQKVQMPHFNEREEIVAGVEFLGLASTDTINLDDDFILITHKYTITSFDENLYYLPPMNVFVDGKNYPTKSLALKVLTMKVDTIHKEKFFQTKDIQDNPFTWNDWIRTILASILLILFIAIVIVLYVRMKANKALFPKIRAVKHVSPHQKAIQKIEEIKASNLLISGNQKEYYTQLTDTIRTYIQERYGFNAMDMTTSEIVEQLNKDENKEKLYEIKELFRTSDLVKFAKLSVPMNDNDKNLARAIGFIDETKNEEKQSEQQIKPVYSEREKEVKRKRTLSKTIISVLIVAIIITIVYILRQLYWLVF